MVEEAEFGLLLLFCAIVTGAILSSRSEKRKFFILKEVRIEVN
jgi:hypothetical protein